MSKICIFEEKVYFFKIKGYTIQEGKIYGAMGISNDILVVTSCIHLFYKKNVTLEP